MAAGVVNSRRGRSPGPSRRAGPKGGLRVGDTTAGSANRTWGRQGTQAGRVPSKRSMEKHQPLLGW